MKNKELLKKYGVKETAGVTKPIQKEVKMSEKKQKNPDHRYIGKVKEIVGKYGPFSTIYLDSTDADNKYNQGALVWIDKETGSQYQVIQMSLQGVNEVALKNGFKNSIRIDLGNERQVKELK